jgi:hypothetical protein
MTYVFAKVDTTNLEVRVRNIDEIEPNQRLILHTIDPSSADGDAGPSRFSVPWKSTLLSQMMLRFKEALPDGDDLERNIYIGVPDCEAEPLMMIAMYLEHYSENPEEVGVVGAATTTATAPEITNLPPSAANQPDNDDDDNVPPVSKMQRAANPGNKMPLPTAAGASAVKSGAHLLERPYKPHQMEVDLKTVVDSEACLQGYEKFLANQICSMSQKDAIRTLRCLLCAGWFLQMNQSFLDLVGWLLSLRYRGHTVHQIKEMMDEKNVCVRPDKI